MFLLGFTKNELILIENDPILFSDSFYTAFKITILDSECGILSIVTLILLIFWNIIIN